MTATHTHDDAVHSHPDQHEHHNPEAGSRDRSEWEQTQLGPSQHGTVMLDIGGEYGALILLAPPSLALAEIEISPADHDDVRTHVAIRERRSPAGTQWAAIYPRLHAGQYTLWDVQGHAVQQLNIVGGEVAQVDWR